MIENDNKGGRIVHLYIPFEANGRKVEHVVFGPFTLDHTLRWQQGEYETAIALALALCEMDETTFRQIRYPDVDRVMGVFFDMLPVEVRTHIAEGRIPQKILPPTPPLTPEEQDTQPQVDSDFNLDE